MDNSSIIMRIEIQLKKLGKTKSEFYKGAGITSATYSQWNTNMFEPSDRKLESVARYLGVSANYLRNGEEEKAPTVSGERNVNDAKAAFFEGYGDDLSEEEKDELWEDARVYARFKAQQKK